MLKPFGIATCGCDHSDTSAQSGYSRSIHARKSCHSAAVASPSGSFFTSEPSISTRKPHAPRSNQNAMIFFSSARTACGRARRSIVASAPSDPASRSRSSAPAESGNSSGCANAELPRLGEQLAQILIRPIARCDLVEIQDVVARIAERRFRTRVQPHRVHPEFPEVRKFLDDPAQVANPVAVRVTKRLRVDLIENRVLQPRRL